MVIGKVKFFHNRKGYGFLTSDQGADYFFHFSDIKSDEGFKTVSKGDTVSFEIGQDADGREKATNVIAITE